MPDCGVREEARHSRAGLLIMPSLRDSVDGYLFLIFYFCEGDFINATNMFVNFGRSKST